MAVVPMRTTEEKKLLAQFIAHRMGITALELIGAVPFEIVAIAKKGFPVGAVMYTNYRRESIEMAGAGDVNWLVRREDLRGIFAYPFVQLGCYTVIANVKRSNTRSRQFVEKLGFTTLGVIESGQGKSEDTVIHTMTRPQCKWLTPADQALVATRHISPALSTANGVHAHGQQSP
jgi:hypothetical protein